MSAIIQEKATIEIPPGLERALNHVVTEYALAHREEPSACRRAVEITVLQRGIRAMQDELRANAALGERMGWTKTEGCDAT